MDLAESGTFGVNVSGKNWIAYINLTPHMTSDIYYSSIAPSPTLAYPTISNGAATPTIYYPSLTTTYQRSDITINLIKNGVNTMQNYSVYSRVTSGRIYTIDLMDETYGIGSLIVPRDTISFVIEKPLNTIQATGNVTYGFTDTNPYSITPIPLGALEYRAQNNYWIPQDYYYQMGGCSSHRTRGMSRTSYPRKYPLPTTRRTT